MLPEVVVKAFLQGLLQLSMLGVTMGNMLDMNHLSAVTGLSGKVMKKG
jgi:hypothetical protein